MQDISDIINNIKKLSIFDVFFLSFIALPFVFQAWTSILKEMGFSPADIRYGLAGIFTIYIILIILMLIGAGWNNRRELARNQIIGYLQSNNYKMMTFDKVREKINNTYADKFIISTIEAFPTSLHRAILKGGKPGVARVIAETEVDEEV